MRYLSICSGIEAATVAWEPMGWTPAGFAEIDKFPSAVLAHHYGSNLAGDELARNGVPNYGDFTRINADHVGPIDLLVGGTPCQSFSVAGLRGGLDDSRGNLALEFCLLARRTRPRWVIWENVPGVLSMDGGHAFASILGGLAECGYHLAYRVLDAQHVRVDGFARAVPQRRRRVFIVGYIGDWRRAAAVLLESEGMRRDPAPRRQAGQTVAPTTSARTKGGGGLGTGFNIDGGLVGHTLNAKGGAGRMDSESETLIAFNSREDPEVTFDRTGPLGASSPQAQAVAFDLRGRDGGAQFEGPHRTANVRAASGGSSRSYVAEPLAVRRLMPVECERLQGFPDGYTQIDWRGKPAANCPDGPRYKAIGNSMAVNVMRWIGRRIEIVEALNKQKF